MDSKITINIVEPGTPPSPTPIDPAVPNTGLFTSGIGGPEATIIVGIIVALIVAATLAILSYRRYKKTGKVTKLVHIIDSTKAVLKSKKRITAGLTAIALLVSAGTFVALAKNAVNASEGDEQSQTEGTNDSSLNVDVSSEELTIEVADEPVFAVLPVEVSVEEATAAGYTLTAYTDSTDLVSTTNPDNKIPMIAVEGEDLVALTDNTYGLALEEPTSIDDEVYTTLSTDQSNPTIIKSMPEYTPTEENNTTTIYYGFYITPDMPYGTYTNDSEVYYNATINTTPVTFDGNGLYFNEDEQQTTNEVEYIAVPEEGKEYNVNQIISGEYKEPSQDLPYNFLGWSTDKNATVPTYTSEQSIAEFLPILPNTPLTLYAVWQKATTITYDSNGGTGDMDTQTIIAGESANLYENTFVKDGYTFTGWNTVAEPTEQTPGKSYTDEELYQAEAESANVTLFAQWKKDILYMQNVSEWGSSLEIGDEAIVVDNRDDKEYYVARLADGNIWMTQNLDHNIVSTPNFYTYANTDIGHGSTPDTTATWTGTATRATSDTAWTGSTTTPESYDPGILYWNGAVLGTQEACVANGGTWEVSYRSECKNANATSSTGNSHYHIGNYYNWTAAVAMSNSSSYTTDNTDVDQSICPAGWMLPKSGTTLTGSGSFIYLADKANLTSGVDGNIHAAPTWFAYSDRWAGNSDINYYRGYQAYYHSSVVEGMGRGYGIFFSAVGYFYKQYDGMIGGYGYSVRCVARPE